MKKALLFVVLPLALLVSGIWFWGTREPAASKTHDRAVALFNAMETYAGTTALDRSDEATREPGVRLVVARNTENGQEIVLAITATSHQKNNFDWWPSENAEYSATRCYRWTDGRKWDTADRVDCPTKTDIDPARASEARGISDTLPARLERALADGGDAAAIRARLADVPDLQVAELGPVLTVAVSPIMGYVDGRPVHDCLFGKRVGQEVSVWAPPRMQVAPGEGACTPEQARSDDRSPH